MKDQEERNQRINREEDERGAAITDANDTEKPADEAFKTSENAKHRTGWETPHDEQMFEDSATAGDEDDETE